MKGIMKPFSLEEHLKNPKMKVVTRYGRTAKIICTNLLSNKNVIAHIEEDGYSLSYDENGRNNNFSTPCDLFFAPEKHEGWINILRGGKYICPIVCIYDSKEKAEENANIDRNCVATVKIEWEE